MANAFPQALAQAHAAYQRGDVAACEALLAPHRRQPKALHLLALAARRQGDDAEARRRFELAYAAARDDVEVANNYARLLSDLGELDRAEAMLQTARRFLPAALQLARLRFDRGHERAALEDYKRLHRKHPDDPFVRFGLGTARLACAQAREAAKDFDWVASRAPERTAALFMRGRARLESGDFDRALPDLEAALAREASDLHLKTVLQASWLMEETERFRTALEKFGTHTALAPVAVDAARQADWLDDALDYAQRAPDSAALRGALASLHLERGEIALARAAASDALSTEPAQEAATSTLLGTLLCDGELQLARAVAQTRRQAAPQSQHWLAYLATLDRLENRNTAEPVFAAELPCPPGFDSLAAFNAALLAELERQPRSHTRPLDQSLRGGSQTFANLAHSGAPALSAYREALAGPIGGYLQALQEGGGPCAERAGRGYMVHDCWSVRLDRDGRHNAHVHPNGWISSAYYAEVPQGLDRGDQAGWLHFGVPPFLPDLAASESIEPSAGLVVLFPSYLWHGTSPTPDRRITLPFDLKPAGE
ncbi:MAG: putative 2OG-Fe(II) oxygenase [Pseudomonadota bacterium]